MMPSVRKKPLKIRCPDEFRDAAEATLGDSLVRWRADERAAEERERHPDIGQKMKDSTVFAGIDPATGKKIFAAPQDAPGRKNFNEAARYAEEMNTQKYLGYDDWEVPSRSVLKVLYDHRHKGALAGTFSEAVNIYNVKSSSPLYWSSLRVRTTSITYGRWFDTAQEGGYSEADSGTVRIVRPVMVAAP